MKREVITYNAIEGFHRYPDAPGFCDFLGKRHRHVFVIRCRFEVTHNEREIEIIEQQRKIDNAIGIRFGKPAEFGDLSCESIAEFLIDSFDNIVEVEVLEDGYGGASLSR